MQSVEAPGPSLSELLRGIGISESYASQLVNGRRTPSLQLALRIHREIGVKMGVLKDASDEEIKALSRVAANQKAA
jgi:transcriptional regulator with XRE-family HTH domain